MPFEAEWLPYASAGLALGTPTFCPQCLYVFILSFTTVGEILPSPTLTGFYNRDGVCLLRGTK